MFPDMRSCSGKASPAFVAWFQPSFPNGSFLSLQISAMPFSFSSLARKRKHTKEPEIFDNEEQEERQVLTTVYRAENPVIEWVAPEESLLVSSFSHSFPALLQSMVSMAMQSNRSHLAKTRNSGLVTRTCFQQISSIVAYSLSAILRLLLQFLERLPQRQYYNMQRLWYMN